MNRYFLPTLIAVFCLLSITECNNNDVDPCGSYWVLNSTERRHRIRGSSGNCDNDLDEGWYKLEIEGRAAEIPTVCIQNNVCGTQLPLRIDLKGQGMPIINKTTHAYACTSYNVLGQWDCCVLRQNVSIRNCGLFYVYHLKPTDRCPVAYCAQVPGENPSEEVTRKRGDVFSRPLSSTASDMSTPVYSNMTATTAGITVKINSTEIIDSPNDTNTEVNVTSGMIKSQNVTESQIAEQHVSGSITNETPVSDIISENTTGFTTSLDGILTTALSRNVTKTDNLHVDRSATIDANETTVVPTMAGAEAFNQTSNNFNITTTENTTANSTLDTLSNLTCKKWPHHICQDNITTCYISPENNETYIACADDSGCGRLCDSFPDCSDSSDETNSLCSIIICLEGLQLCSDGSDCYNRCDGHTTCKTTSAGEDEDMCPTRSTVSYNTDVTLVTVNVTETSENSTSTPNLTSPAGDLLTDAVHGSTEGIVSVTESATEYANVTVTSVANITEGSDIPFTDTSTAVKNDTVELTSTATEQPHDTRTEISFPRSTFHENVSVSGSVLSINKSVITTESTFSEGTVDSVGNVTSRQTKRVTDSEGIQASSTYEVPDGVNNTTNAVNTQPDTFENASITQVSLTTISENGSNIPYVTTAGATVTRESSYTTAVSPGDEKTTLDTDITTGRLETTQATEISSTSIGTSQSSEKQIQTTQVPDETPVSGRGTEITTGSSYSSSVTTKRILSSSGVSRRQTPTEISTAETKEGILTGTTAQPDDDLSTATMEITQSSDATDLPDASTIQTTVTSASSTEESTSIAASVISTTLTTSTETESRSTVDISSTEGEVRHTETSYSSSVTTKRILSSSGVSRRQTPTEISTAETKEGILTGTTAQPDDDLSTATMEITQSSDATDLPDASTIQTTVKSASSTEESTSIAASVISTTLTTPTETESRSTVDISSTEGEVRHTGHTNDHSSSSDVRIDTNTVSDTSPIGEATGPHPTQSANNQTDHTVIKEKSRSIFYTNFGLFVFLVVAGAVIVGICLFGLIGYTYRRRLRTWNPTMVYQDAYGNMEKTTLSFGRNKHGIDSPIPDFDILQDEQTVEETSLSRASTLALGQTQGRSEPPFDDTIDVASSSKFTNGNATPGEPEQNNEVSYITNGQANEGFVADDNLDGIVPVDELDTSLPRALFPWIENSVDTQL